MQFKWTPEYSVKVQQLDAQHKTLIVIMDELYSLLLANDSADKINHSFDQIFTFAAEHFATEEKLFAEYHYPGAEEHIKHHRMIVTQLQELRAQNDIDIYQLGFKLLDLLEDWLVVHMNTMDKKYSEWFNQHGLF